MANNTSPWALITGANGGIGQALSKEFLASGYKVLATDYQNQSIFNSTNLFYIELDLDQFASNISCAQDFFIKVNEITKNQGIKSLINNAAIQHLGSCENVSRLEWNKSININLSAPFFLTQMFLPELTKNNGAIVNISSIHATQTKKRFVTYATTKAALSGLTRSLAVDLETKVRINAIEPAAISTEMLIEGFAGKSSELSQLESYHPIKRLGKPQEVAELANYLCSEKANFIHGSCISISGGIKESLSDPRSFQGD